MGLLKKLKEVRSTKQAYFILQRNLYQELSKRYPYIMGRNMGKLANRLEFELHNMLACSLKFKSIQIKLLSCRYIHKGNGGFDAKNPDMVCVQRGDPGFYFSYSARGSSDIDYLNNRYYIDKNDDMCTKFTDVDEDTNGKKTVTEVDEIKVKLSELKALGPRMIPVKLDAYFKILREVMAYKKYIMTYLDTRTTEIKSREFSCGELDFCINEKSLDVIRKADRRSNDKDKADEDGSDDCYRDDNNPDGISFCNRFLYNASHSDMYHLLDYSRHQSKSLDRSFDAGVHERLKLFIDNYKEIASHLKEEEIRKKKVVQTCDRFIQLLRIHTTPFKVLVEITRK